MHNEKVGGFRDKKEFTSPSERGFSSSSKARNCPMPHEETTIEQSRFSGLNPSRGRGRGRFGTDRRTSTDSSQVCKEQLQARVFAMTQEEAKATPTVITVTKNKMKENQEVDVEKEHVALIPRFSDEADERLAGIGACEE
ncbi:hypothetical protein BUALT_Bualt06G0041400 [Buddleja alternifolia]|uniref:Uncharacterized protein n=1 Tax=Buddleja alternifolia TaxID=168488 RepID=A0AAV6XJD5_9LAMI|nr:hypothetical protein BUALT_Bualt06G0041400 [Buddleja alternifolia]